MSIRTVQTSFTSSASNILSPLSMNHPSPRSAASASSSFAKDKEGQRKFPPGLGHGSDSQQSQPSPPSVGRRTRQRSGSFTFPSGCSYNHFDRVVTPPPSSRNVLGTLTSPFTPSTQSPMTTAPLSIAASRRTGHISRAPHGPYAGAGVSSGRFGYGSGIELSKEMALAMSRRARTPPPPPSAQRSQTGEFKRTLSGKFDPFGCDEQEPLDSEAEWDYDSDSDGLTGGMGHTSISASSTTYSHYWQYDPTSNKPMLVFTPPPLPPTNSRSITPTSTKSPSSVPFTISLPSANLSTASLPNLSSSKPSRHAQIPIPARLTIPPADKNTQYKKLAVTLLNRIYAVGKPARRRLSCTSASAGATSPEKEYVRSGLSRVVSVEC